MARKARGESVDPERVQVFHLTARCVRRAFLCGTDCYTGKDYSHRKEWIQQRMEFVATVFGIDLLSFAIMSNHSHQVVRTRVDLVLTWSPEEIARRWLTLYPAKRNKDGTPRKPTKAQINKIVKNPTRLAELRRRLSNISWWMKSISEYVARKANKEDECTGRFWEGRFESVEILDEAGVLACATYVELNPIRAAMAETPETSEHTSAKSRIDDLKEANQAKPVRERDRVLKHSRFLSPVQIDERNDPIGPDPDDSGFRASLKGLLPISLEQFLELIDWTGRNIRSDKRGAIPANLDPIMNRLGINTGSWCKLIETFKSCFKRVVGSSSQLEDAAKARGQQRLQAPGLGLLYK